MRKRILTVTVLALAFVTWSTMASAQADDPLSKVVLDKTNDANADFIFTDDEVTAHFLPPGQVPHQVTITNGGQTDAEIAFITDDTYPPVSPTDPCSVLIGFILKPGVTVSCLLHGSPPSSTEVSTALVEVTHDDNSRQLEDSTTVRPAALQAFNVRIQVFGNLFGGKIEGVELMVDEENTMGPIAIFSTKITATIEGVSVRVKFSTTIVVQAEEFEDNGLDQTVVVQAEEIGDNGLDQTVVPFTITGWSVEGAPPTEIDIRDVSVNTKKLKEKGLFATASNREIVVEVDSFFAPDPQGAFGGEFDIKGLVKDHPFPL